MDYINRTNAFKKEEENLKTHYLYKGKWHKRKEDSFELRCLTESDKIPFGKYKNWTLEEIIRTDVNYMSFIGYTINDRWSTSLILLFKSHYVPPYKQT